MSNIRFIAIEGLDGAGKSTQVELLKKYYESQGAECYCVHFPRVENKPWGELIAKFLRGGFGKLNELDPYLVALLYAEDRHNMASQIFGWLHSECVVIVDRYVYSNIAFQCAKLSGEAARRKLFRWIWKLEYDEFAIPYPELTLFLDVPFDFTQRKLSEPRRGSDRRYLAGKSDIHEADLDFQRRVREVYLDFQRRRDFRVVGCADESGVMLPADAIFQKIKAALKLK
ncbi:MAG: dTMP kinase [Prevotellaceae bacterium]|nr:dTMP kinase [Prevotellaceae bacterium]